MNLNWEEKRIRQLFGEMSRDDARRAPDFEMLVQAGSRSVARSKSGVRALAVAGSFAVLLAAVVTAAVLIVRHPNNQSPSDADRPVAESVAPAEPPEPAIPRRPPGVATNHAPVRHAAKRIQNQRRSNELAIAMKSLSVWESPTASLLKVPGEELLKSLPRLGDSLQTLRSFSPDQIN
jgi:hypothetical protein